MRHSAPYSQEIPFPSYSASNRIILRAKGWCLVPFKLGALKEEIWHLSLSALVLPSVLWTVRTKCVHHPLAPSG